MASNSHPHLPVVDGQSVSLADLTVRDLRRLWKPTKLRLAAESPNHPTSIRVHRAFSWLARVEQIGDHADLDLALICQWIAFNSLYGQWNESTREPKPDRDCWKNFLERLLQLDLDSQLKCLLLAHKQLVLALLDDPYLSKFFWQEPSSSRALRARRTKQDAHSWYLEQRWIVILDSVIERAYLMRCQLVHGAATFGGKLNRDSLRRTSTMLSHLLKAVLLVIISHGGDQDWGLMCYAPVGPALRPR